MVYVETTFYHIKSRIMFLHIKQKPHNFYKISVVVYSIIDREKPFNALSKINFRKFSRYKHYQIKLLVPNIIGTPRLIHKDIYF